MLDGAPAAHLDAEGGVELDRGVDNGSTHTKRHRQLGIKQFVRTARRYRTIDIRTGQHTVTAEEPLPADLRDALSQIA